MADIVDTLVSQRAMVRRDEPASPLVSRWYVVDGMSMHVRASHRLPIERPNVVCVHGIGVSSLYMVPVAQRLATFSQVYAPDLPGFGLSDKPREVLDLDGLACVLAHFLELADATPAVLLGNSFGCQIAVRCALRYPHLVSGLILEGPTINPAECSASKQIYRWCSTLPREPMLMWLVAARDYLICGPRRFWKTFQIALADPIEEHLRRVDVPTLVVRGERDPIAPQSWAEAVAKLVPHARLEVIEGAAHTVNFAAPDALAAVSRAFVLDEVSRRRRYG